jgi:hypothetical protein
MENADPQDICQTRDIALNRNSGLPRGDARIPRNIG